QAQAYVAQGFRILKVRVGLEPFALDIARLRAVREAVGDAIALAVDANQAWTVKQAIGRIHALERFGLDTVEQPVAARDLTGMAEVARAVDTPLMADESLYSLEDAMTLVRLGAVGYFHVKLVKAGGLHRARQLIALAEAAGLGEARGNSHYLTGDTPDRVVAEILQHLGPRLVGREPRELHALLAELDQAVVGAHGSRSALDLALHDLVGHAYGVPVFALLGGAVRETLPSNQSIWYGPPDAAARQAAAYVADGFRFLKVRSGLRPFQRDVDRI